MQCANALRNVRHVLVFWNMAASTETGDAVGDDVVCCVASREVVMDFEKTQLWILETHQKIKKSLLKK